MMFFRKNKALCFLAVFALFEVATVAAAPFSPGSLDPEETAGQFEGDMILSEAQLNLLRGISTTQPQGRNGLISEEMRWPNRIVLYRIVGDFDSNHRNAILEGIATLESLTCVRFQEADSSATKYLAITSNANGCYTAVGYKGKVQQMNLQIFPLDEGCFRTGSILHEFLHALGFYHQQSDAHRDDYIDVRYDNIVPGKEFNFDKYSDAVVTDFDVGYDYDSVMHYRSDAFSVNGKDTIVPYDTKAEIGQRVALSKKDIMKINIMYKCPIQI